MKDQFSAALSFAQQRLWFLDQLETRSSAYVISSAFRIHGPLDVGSLEEAFGALAARHESLRTRFPGEKEQQQQVVVEAAPFSLPVIDVASESELAVAMSEETDRGFDLESGPLFRATCYRLGPEEWALLLTMHHIISDGWSVGVLVQELGALYGDFCADRAPALPELPIQYADYAEWQREWLQGGVEEKQLTYWRSRLAGAPQVLELPADRPRPPVETHQGDVHAFVVPRETTDAFSALVRAEGVTPFMGLLAAFSVLLWRYTGQEDLLVGTPVAGRDRPETEGLVGLFVNTLVLRADLSGDPTVRKLLGRVRETCLDAYTHQDLPLERLVQELRPERDLSRNPLFQVMLTLQNTPDETLELPGLAVTSVPVRRRTAQLDLSLHLRQVPEGLRGAFEYSTDLFEKETIRRMADHFEMLLRAIVDRPESRVSALTVLTDGEREAIASWNRTEAPFPEERVHELISRQAARTPARVAAESGRKFLTYRELEERSAALGRRLRGLGVRPGVRVGLFLERGLEMVVGVLGVLKAGGAYVPLDPAFPPERLRYMVEDSGASVLLTQSGVEGEIPTQSLSVLRVDDASADPGVDLEGPGPDSEDLAYVIYTSGSTGKPKGVAVTHRNLVNFLSSMGREPGLSEGDVLLSVTTLSFDIAALELYLPLMQGGRVVVASREEASDGRQLLERLESSGVTVMQATPATWRVLIESGWEGTAGLKVLCGGEALPRELAKALLDRAAELWNVYGPTETTVWSSVWRVEPGEGPVSIGRPIANTQMWVLDESLEPVPVGVPGELYIGGEGVARGYWERSELTSERFVSDPFSGEEGSRLYRTGDLARYLSDGRLECLGRLDHQVKVRGFRIELGEIEASLEGHESVKQAVVVARDSASGDTRLVSYVVGEGEVSASDLRSHLSQTLPDYMVPSAFVSLESFPLTPNGKVDRKALPAPEGLMAREEEYVAPRTPTEEILAGIWEEILRVERVGAEDDFFALGGHSLLATQVVSRVRKALGVEVPLRELFAAPRMGQLAAAVEGQRRSGEAGPAQPRLAAEPYQGPEPLSYSQQRLWFLDQVDPGRATYVLPVALRVQGALDAGALEEALGALAARHESLRTTFTRAGEPRQIVAEAGPVSLPVVDLTGEAGLLGSAMTEQIERGFDLAQGPPFRAVLYRLGPEEHVLLLAIHHIVSDEWSLGVLVRELGELYGGLVNSQEVSLPALPVQYRDFARWQRDWLAGEVQARQLEYWRTHLAGAPTVLELPTDRPRPPVETHRGATRYLSIPREVSEGLTALARREGATLFMVLLAAFDVLLSRYTRQEDLLVGTPVANRSRAELEGLVGFFVNTLVLRADLSGDPTVQELLGRVREACLGAYTHQDLPFEKLVEELQPERDPSRNPLFQVMLVLQNVPVEESALEGLTLTPVRTERGTSTFDLTLILEETSEGLRGAFEYATDLFDEDTIRRMAGHLEILLREMVERPTARVSGLPLLTESEREQVVVEWNRTAREFPSDICVHELVSAQARRTPEATAVEFEGRSLTYGELEQASGRLAARLRARGVTPGARVGVFMERGPEVVLSQLGILKAGGAFVPIDAALPEERVRYMAEDASLALLLTTGATEGQLAACPAPTLRVDEEGPEETFEAVEGGARPDDLAYLIYTSGSTGRPKGVGVSHRSLVNLLGACTREMDLTGEDVALQVTTPSFDPSVLDTFAALSLGMRLVLVSREVVSDGPRLAERLASTGATVVIGTPAICRVLLDASWEGRPDLKVLTGGEALTRELADYLRSRAGGGVWNAYGPTEATVIASVWPVAAEGPIPIGHPIDNLQLYVLDGRLEPVPVGVPGELYIGGVGVARGYWARPELTAERFVPDPFSSEPGARLYQTGDLVRWLPDANLDYLGRIDHQVKVRGFRIELGEIETELERHDAVKQAVVVTRPGPGGADRLVSYVVPCDDAEVPTAELRKALRRTLPDYMIPSVFVSQPSLPLSSSGKVDRKALPDPDHLRSEEAPIVAPRTETERALVEIWCEVLELPRVSIQDNFFDLGGHSMLAPALVQRVERRLGRPLGFRALMFQTIEQIAQALDEAEPARIEAPPPPAGLLGRLTAMLRGRE